MIQFCEKESENVKQNEYGFFDGHLHFYRDSLNSQFFLHREKEIETDEDDSGKDDVDLHFGEESI